MKKFYGYIYVTTNQQTKKVYVGQKFGLPEESFNYLGSGTRLRDSIKHYGKQFFKKRILGVLEASTKKELKNLLNEAETECIYFYRAYGSSGVNYDEIYGYNMTIIGDSCLGCKRTEDFKNNTGKKSKGRIFSDESIAKRTATRKRNNKPIKMKPFTDEHCENISKRRLGIIFTQEHCDNISKGKSGKCLPHTKEWNDNISKAKIGKPSKIIGQKRTIEQIQNMSKAKLKDWENRKLNDYKFKGKTYRITFVDNSFIIVNPLSVWCRENDIIRSSLNSALDNNRVYKNIINVEIMNK